MMGTLSVSRIRRHTSVPSMSGRPRSSTIRSGRSPSTLGNYNAETSALSLRLGADYQSRWRGDLSWVMNFGPDAPLADRDFAGINVSFAF